MANGATAVFVGSVGLLLISFAGAATALEHWDDQSKPPPCVIKSATATNPTEFEVLRVGDGASKTVPVVRLHHALCVIVANVTSGTEPTAQNKEQEAAKARTGLNAAASEVNLALFVDGVRIPDAAVPAKAQAAPQPLIFKFEPADDATSEAAKTWRKVLGGLPSGGSRDVRVGVGRADAVRPADEWDGPGTKLHIFTPWIASVAGLGFLALLAAVVMAGRSTSLLRDGPAGSTYSLARVQMAFWMVATIFGFVFIWVVTGQYLNVVTPGTFTLIGIAGATGLAASAIDADAVPPKSKNLVADILSDGTREPKLHRIQAAIWTLVLGVIFIWNALDSFILTNFDTNLLLLMGIANGVYAGLKTQEEPAAAPATPAARKPPASP